VGCSLATSLVSDIKKIRRNLTPDFLFIEPSELVVTEEMRHAAVMARRDINYDVGPFITLVDGPGFQALWQERQPLLLGQIAGADLVAVSKSDLIGAGRMEEIMHTLQGYSRGVLRLSSYSGSGLEEVVKAIEGSS
jgi:G3E family GTPase